MADEDAEMIGGIEVSVGANHSQLVADLARADQILEAWAKQKFTVNIGATATAPTGTAARPAAGPSSSVVFGPQARAAAQAQAAQPAMYAKINEALAKTGERYNTITGEIESATQAATRQKNVIVDVQQTAAKPTELGVDFGSTLNDAQALNAALRETVTLLKEAAALPPPRATPRVTTTPSGGGALTPEQLVAAARNLSPADAAKVLAGMGIGGASTGAATASTRAARIAAASAASQAATNAMGPGQGALASGTLASPLTQAQQAQQARQAAQAAAAPQATPKTPQQQAAFNQRAQQQAAQANAVRGGGGGVNTTAREELAFEIRQRRSAFTARLRDEQILRAQSENQIREEARVATAGRTARTTASGFGGFFGGPGRARAEAQTGLEAAKALTANATRSRLVFENEIIATEAKASVSTGIRARDLRAFAASLKASTGYKDAIKGQADAITNEAVAAEKLQKAGTGAANAAKSLASVTLAGAAFGLGLQVIGVALDLVGKAATPAIDRLTGFATVAGRVTDALSDQTKQANGNVRAVVAAAEAQAGLSAKTAAAINPLIEEQAAIEAGNKNLSDAVDLFQTYQKLRQSGVQGLTNNTGGFAGSGILGTQGTLQDIGKLFQGLPRTSDQVAGPASGAVYHRTGQVSISSEQAQTNASLFREGLDFANEQVAKGGERNLRFVSGAGNQSAVDASVAAAQQAHAPDDFINALRDGHIAIVGLSDDAKTAANQIIELADAANRGTRVFDAIVYSTAALRNEQQRQKESAASLDAIRSQQAFSMPSIIGAAARQLAFTTQVQQPAQFALSALANPNLPVGTGIAPEDQAKVMQGMKEAQALQDQLNAKYAQGQKIIEDTYKPAILRDFGEAGKAAFNDALGVVTSTGAKIAEISASMSNEQAAYQVAQYNFQLQIAKRSLSDIGGLIGQNLGAGKSELGLLEGQNLALSRQAQQLQFGMSQRQINFQTAVAGFQAPGVTPEERQARVKEAEIEASFAQKQLNIQKQMFGNQVKIVDISNIRQGYDLVKQIFGPGGLIAGRQVTIDLQIKQQNITRLQQIQSQATLTVNTYIGQVDGLASAAIGQIQQIEAAAGEAMATVATDILSQFNIFFTGINDYLTGIGGGTNKGVHGTAAGSGPGGPAPEPSNPYAGIDPRTGMPYVTHASGGAYNLTSPTRIGANGIAGEAGDETLVILSHPRGISSGTSGGGGNVIINFNAPIGVRSEADIDLLARKVGAIIGREASLKGFRALGSSG